MLPFCIVYCCVVALFPIWVMQLCSDNPLKVIFASTLTIPRFLLRESKAAIETLLCREHVMMRVHQLRNARLLECYSCSPGLDELKQ